MTVEVLDLLSRSLAPQRQVLRAGDAIYRAGERFGHLYILNAGFVKIVKRTPEGQDQIVGLKMRGDWLGFDGIANGSYLSDALALDTGEVWVMRYDALLAASLGQPRLLRVLHEAMSRAINHSRDSLISICSLPADARVARFLRDWAASLASRGLRTDRFCLRMTRAEIGNYLGMTLETVSRALSKLARDGVIAFAGKGRRDIVVPDAVALSRFVQHGPPLPARDEMATPASAHATHS
ncbi:fumarate/nitrate reduction transcriptional regulator Fnr [soil metagenome]